MRDATAKEINMKLDLISTTKYQSQAKKNRSDNEFKFWEKVFVRIKDKRNRLTPMASIPINYICQKLCMSTNVYHVSFIYEVCTRDNLMWNLKKYLPFVKDKLGIELLENC